MWNIRKIISKGDYNYVLVPEHPSATENGYVLEHRIVMENHLGRLLKKEEVVHHKDGNRKNNHIDNLEVLSNNYHAAMHTASRGRMMVDLQCPWCNKQFSKYKSQTYLSKGGFFTACSKRCRGKLSAEIQYHGKTKAIKHALFHNVIKEYKEYKLP